MDTSGLAASSGPTNRTKGRASMTDAWAEVELFRMQYGELPGPEDKRKLDVPDALDALAKRIGSNEQMSAFNLQQMIVAVAKWFRDGVAENAAQADRITTLTTALRRLLHHSKAAAKYISPQDDEEDAAQIHKFEVSIELGEDALS